MNQLSYRGSIGTTEVSVEDKCLHGRVQHITDTIMNEGETYQALERAFHAAIDRYLDYCARTSQTYTYVNQENNKRWRLAMRGEIKTLADKRFGGGALC